jgi:ubiquitin carboxyl-terminal hydrolase L5
MGMSKRDKGEAIGNSELIRQVHNSFARQDPFTIEEEDDKGGKEDDDVFHFISYVPYKGILYELDGCQPGPISYGECNDDDWLSKARVEIQKRIEKYS